MKVRDKSRNDATKRQIRSCEDQKDGTRKQNEFERRMVYQQGSKGGDDKRLTI